MTEKQKNLYSFIVEYTASNHRPPTIREMASHIKVSSPGTVHDHLRSMVNNGLLIKLGGGSRNYLPVDTPKKITLDELYQIWTKVPNSSLGQLMIMGETPDMPLEEIDDYNLLKNIAEKTTVVNT